MKASPTERAARGEELPDPPEAIASLVAEISVLGGVLLDGTVLTELRDTLPPGDFYWRAHRVLWKAFLALDDEGSPVDMVTVYDHLGEERMTEVGGLEHLAALVDQVVTAANVGYWARIVREKAALRRLHRACATTMRALEAAEGDDAADVMVQAENRLLTVLQDVGGQGRRGYRDAPAAVAAARALIDRAATARAEGRGVVGVPTGFPWLDRLTGGLLPGDVTILAARPAMGKTALALGVMDAAAARGHVAAMVNYEMSDAMMMTRALAHAAQIDGVRLRTGALRPGEHEALDRAAERWAAMPIWIDDAPDPTVEGVRSALRRLLARAPVRLLVVDYLQQMTGPGSNRNAQIEHVSRGFKRLARELDVHVMLLSQLSRAVENRRPQRPQLSDLRDSGAIEQDADLVLTLWRPEYYFDDSTSPEWRATWTARGELAIEKQRNGATGRCRLHWAAPYMRFTELAREDDRP